MTNAEDELAFPVEIGKTEVVVTISDRDLEQLVRTVYGIANYSFHAVEECGNDTIHRFDVRTKTLYDPAKVEDAHTLALLAKVNAGAVPTGANYVILQDLVNRGVLKPGMYLIEVFW